MVNVFDLFDAAYLINLPERVDRLASSRRELDRAGSKIGPDAVRMFEAYRVADRGPFPSAAVRGCFLSHRGCLLEGKARGANAVLVMEDDIALTSHMGTVRAQLADVVNSDTWDFLYLGHDDTGSYPLLRKKTRDVEFFNYQGVIRGNHFYAVSNRIIGRLIDHLNTVVSGVEGDQEYGPMPIDGAFNIFRWKNPDVRTLIASPKLGWQRPFRSDITPRYFDGVRVLRPILAMLREVKSSIMR